MNQWIDVSKELPPMGRPVLAVAKRYGGRDHWLCAALRRGNAEDWIWAVSNGERNDSSNFDNEGILHHPLDVLTRTAKTERNMSGNTEMTDAQQAITVHNVALTPVEFNGLRVVTLAMIDRVRQRPEGTARVTFNMHKDRLLEGKDYFVCDTYEAKLLILTQFFSLSQDIQKAGPTRGASDHKIVGVLGCNSFVTFMYSFITQYAQSMGPLRNLLRGFKVTQSRINQIVKRLLSCIFFQYNFAGFFQNAATGDNCQTGRGRQYLKQFRKFQSNPCWKTFRFWLFNITRRILRFNFIRRIENTGRFVSRGSVMPTAYSVRAYQTSLRVHKVIQGRNLLRNPIWAWGSRLTNKEPLALL